MKPVCLLGFGLLIALPTLISAEELTLIEGKSYRLEKQIEIVPVSVRTKNQEDCSGAELEANPNTIRIAGKKSKFEVVDNQDGGCHIVRFWSIKKPGEKTDSSKLVNEYEEYILPQKIHGVPVSASTTRNGKISGLLVVPYKYRTDDGSVTGEATVGYYAGWETRIGTYLLSAGLSQVSIPVSDTETENQSAVTLATGFLLSNWDNIDLGLVVGLDHIGGSKGNSWQYEDDPWISVMIGWDFSQ